MIVTVSLKYNNYFSVLSHC